MKVVKDNPDIQKIELPLKLQELIKTNVDQIAAAQSAVNNLVSGFLADKSIPEGHEVALSGDGKTIVLNKVVAE